MFGMEDNNKEDQAEVEIPQFSFELEQEVSSNPNKKKEIRKIVENRIQAIRKLLQKGCSEKEFKECQTLLKGYLSLATTVERIKVAAS